MLLRSNVFMILLLNTTQCLTAFSFGTISGVVIDGSTKEHPPLVNVVIKGTPAGTTTDLTARFVLVTDETELKLQVSLVGFRTESVALKVGDEAVAVSISLFPNGPVLAGNYGVREPCRGFGISGGKRPLATKPEDCGNIESNPRCVPVNSIPARNCGE